MIKKKKGVKIDITRNYILARLSAYWLPLTLGKKLPYTSLPISRIEDDNIQLIYTRVRSFQGGGIFKSR